MMPRKPIMYGTSPALQLLLDCCTGNGHSETLVLDWDHFLALVQYHRVGPQAHSALLGVPDMPTRVTEALARFARLSAFNGLAQGAELAMVASVLDRAGIPVLALKGPVEDLLCRGGLGNRSAVDVDIFIPPALVKEAVIALGKAGWRGSSGHSDPASPWRSNRDNHCWLRRGTDYPNVELHWRLLRIHTDFPLTVEQALTLAEPISLGGEVIRTLPLAHRILYLCAHGSHHIWDQISRLLDISAYLVRGMPPQVGTLAVEMGLERPLLLAIHLAHRILDAPVPGWLGHVLSHDTDVADLAERAVNFWDVPKRLSDGGLGRWDRLSYALALHHNTAGRTRALAERLWRKLSPGPFLDRVTIG